MSTALVIAHGGAGDRASQAVGNGLEAAIAAAWAEMARGPLPAAVAAARVLENDPAFNAGRGSARNADGEVEMDAAVMIGANRAVGAVAAVRLLRNPVDAAWEVLKDGRHALLAGEGAMRFARERGIEQAPEAYFAGVQTASPGGDTIGVICRDGAGRLAVAVSTGGIGGKRPGRVGDSPICGAGFYADDAAGAACATGDGEAFLRLVLSKWAVDRVAECLDARVAASQAIAELDRSGFGRGGLLVLGRTGPPGVEHNAARLPWAWRDASGRTGRSPDLAGM